MLLLLLAFPILTIISSGCFIYPFIVSTNPSSLYLYHRCWFVCCSGVAVDTQFTGSKLSFGRKYRFHDNGNPHVLSFSGHWSRHFMRWQRSYCPGWRNIWRWMEHSVWFILVDDVGPVSVISASRTNNSSFISNHSTKQFTLSNNLTHNPSNK